MFKLLLLFISVALFSCSEPTVASELIDVYDYSPERISVKGLTTDIKKVTLINYTKDGSFKKEVSRKKVEMKAVLYDSLLDRSCFLITEIDYHFDFELVLESDSISMIHRVSNVLIEKVKASPFDYMKMREYVYNDSIYRDNYCDFLLDRPVVKRGN